MSQGYSRGACTNCSSCGGCSSGGLEHIAASEVSYQGSSEEVVSYSGSNVAHYEVSDGVGDNYSFGSSVSGYNFGSVANSGYSFSSNLAGRYSASFNSGGFLNYNQLDQGISNQNYKTSLRNIGLINNVFSSNLDQGPGFIPDNFLKPNRISHKFVGKAEEIRSEIEETFLTLTGLEFPEDVRIKICDRKEFNKFTSNLGVVGLSINRKEQGLISDIFILNDEFDKVMLTIGHELGHVMSRTLNDSKDEEAKAFAFSFAWMKTIKENNIGELGRSIVFDSPASNGIHDVAFSFVTKKLKEGKEALELYWDLVKGLGGVSIVG